MPAPHEHKYAVMAGYMTDNIYVGRVNKAGNAFLSKEEATDMVLAAVAQYVMRNFDIPEKNRAGTHTTFPKLGIEVEIRVWPVSGNGTVDKAEKGSES